jgi:glutathione synthase/RimK-type ligase-like ATP-grasp enzyme
MRLVVIDNEQDRASLSTGEAAVTARDFIAGNCPSTTECVINRCRDTAYLSLGYHVSIVAEARDLTVTPSVTELLDIHRGHKQPLGSAVARSITPHGASYRLAMLHNPAEGIPPSNAEALQNFIRIGRKMGIVVEPITSDDYERLGDFDALFIRETTDIDDTTYRFSRKARELGIPVTDDPDSIARCANKIFLAERMQTNNVPTPKTLFIDRDHLDLIEPELGFPVVLKTPNGAFSRNVHKAGNRGELQEIANRLFATTDLILAQKFVRTSFDWRIGVLHGQAIYACQYFMADGHWQVLKYSGPGRNDYVEGGYRTLTLIEAPAEAVALGVKAANLIGDGLYGVDIKETNEGFFVIEVNDNPNVDAGVEDAILGDELYRLILEDFVSRIEAGKLGHGVPHAI